MCHHKAPHRNWQYHPRYRDIYAPGTIPLPQTFDDDYQNRAAAAAAAKMRVRSDMLYEDLGLVQPEGGADMAGEMMVDSWPMRKVPELKPGETITVICAETGENFTFDDPKAFAEFKYQRYMSRYLRTVQAIDDGVGRMLDKLDAARPHRKHRGHLYLRPGLLPGRARLVRQAFHVRGELSDAVPRAAIRRRSRPAATSKDIACNVDFAPTFLDYAGLPVPSYMQGVSMRPVLEGRTPADWDQVAYHRYWMHNDMIHEAWAHYGVRDQRYKLIYWYNDDLGQLGARPNGAPPEWELFDCDEDPL